MVARVVGRAAWAPALCLVALLAFQPTAAQAQGPEKARAEVKKLTAQLDDLHAQMLALAAKLEKARAKAASLSSTKEKSATHHHWGMFARSGMHHHMWAAHQRQAWHHFGGSFADADMHHGWWHHTAARHEASGTRELERKVDRLDREVHELVRTLRAGRTKR